MANQISFDTNSKDPEKMKARVFVAGLGLGTTRDEIIDLFASYGRIVGASMFKGFAFIQYTNATEAELATMALHGYTYKRAMLEVKIAYDPSKVSANAPAPQKRKRDDSEPANKKIKNEEPPAVLAEKPDNSHQKTTTDVTTDIFICGGCEYVTNYLEEFLDHRKESCTKKAKKDPTEPESFRCFTCSNTFRTSWELLYHLRVAHEITMYKIARD
uniref:RRM domain-containing protein n=1 Tax=Panagrolaimus sp. JU765 TaxID=591449 RepID=A0AC34RM14_9BILA